MLDARTSGRRGPFGSDEGMTQLFASAGLVDVRTVHTTVQARFRDPAHVVQFSWSHGQRAMWEAVPADRHDELRGAVLEALASVRDDAGGITFEQDVRHTLGSRA